MTLNYKTAVANILQATHFLKAELDRLTMETAPHMQPTVKVSQTPLTPQMIKKLSAPVDARASERDQAAVDRVLKPAPTPAGMPPAPSAEQMTKDAKNLMAQLELEARLKTPPPVHTQAQGSPQSSVTAAPQKPAGTVVNAKKGKGASKK